MKARLKMGKVYPGAYKALDQLDQLTAASNVEPWYKEMIRIRASQINGCAYCVNSHSGDALKLGIDFRKINLLSAWREATNVFSDEERLVIRMTEEITLIHQQGLRDETYDKAIQTFGEEKTAALMMVMITINAWNRIGVGLSLQPEIS